MFSWTGRYIQTVERVLEQAHICPTFSWTGYSYSSRGFLSCRLVVQTRVADRIRGQGYAANSAAMIEFKSRSRYSVATRTALRIATWLLLPWQIMTAPFTPNNGAPPYSA